MSRKKQKFEFRTEVEKTKYLNEIIAYFRDERGEEIGVVAAESVLDFFLFSIGDDIYKKAVEDVRKILKERMADIDVEIGSLSIK
jgi:uncharacterized protein (DUF2164 family)